MRESLTDQSMHSMHRLQISSPVNLPPIGPIKPNGNGLSPRLLIAMGLAFFSIQRERIQRENYKNVISQQKMPTRIPDTLLAAGPKSALHSGNRGSDHWTQIKVPFYILHIGRTPNREASCISFFRFSILCYPHSSCLP